jgi:LCP family protein required for cell wall assembly
MAEANASGGEAAQGGTDGEADPSSSGGGSARRTTTRRRVLRTIGIGTAVLFLAAAGTGWWIYRSLDGNIQAVDLDRALGDDRPPKALSALGATDILILGSDSRAGDNAELDGGPVGGARSDTALVMHVSENRTEAVAVSIPRDTLVSRPSCVTADGTELGPATRVMFNSVYAQAGSACVVKTVEKMSGVRIDHLLEIDFAGFKELVDEIGGVTVDVSDPIHDTKGGFTLEAGSHHLNGTDSLKFVRTRHGYGDGSDLGRIGLQQQFLTALLSEVRQQDLLGDPVKSYRIARSMTKSLTTDSELASLTALAEFGRSMQGIDPGSLDTVMLPVEYDRADPNRVVAAEPQATDLWEAIRQDEEIPASARKSPATGG